MAAYATTDDVLARVGRIGGAFSVAGRRPNLIDVAGFLDELSVDVDEAVRGYDIDPTSLDANAKKVLLDLVAYGAAARALRALGDRSPEVLQILVEADAVWTAAMGDSAGTGGSIRDGSHPVIRALLAQQAGSSTAGVTAGSFWQDEPDYGRLPALQREFDALWGTNLAPGVSKGQHL